MKQTVNKYDFERAFELAGRKDQFSHAGQLALFEYLEEYEDCTGEAIELDVIAICCDFAEYETAIEAVADYVGKDEVPEDEDAALDYLRDHTSVVEFEGGLIIQSF